MPRNRVPLRGVNGRVFASSDCRKSCGSRGHSSCAAAHSVPLVALTGRTLVVSLFSPHGYSPFCYRDRVRKEAVERGRNNHQELARAEQLTNTLLQGATNPSLSAVLVWPTADMYARAYTLVHRACYERQLGLTDLDNLTDPHGPFSTVCIFCHRQSATIWKAPQTLTRWDVYGGTPAGLHKRWEPVVTTADHC